MSVQITEDLGLRIAEEGTERHRAALENLAASVKGFAPGAAAALVDWTGSEVSRLRAWAVARSALLERIADTQAELESATAGRGAFRLTA
ncbi:hypothetical protein [Demequina mangrovi]|uniref:Uncharacterized protein n=1 Tax=Demequina mangrovi TaxID=1043493 RepID=A0A1H7B8Q0_9MICO|nr:hypothetical protein [Demequina mangrovi]SEJ70670.1 hypothetical protein SAMN05421637_2750 [Demequina mangrovi]